jgi:hypothetical protein
MRVNKKLPYLVITVLGIGMIAGVLMMTKENVQLQAVSTIQPISLPLNQDVKGVSTERPSQPARIVASSAHDSQMMIMAAVASVCVLGTVLFFLGKLGILSHLLHPHPTHPVSHDYDIGMGGFKISKRK